MAGKGGGAWKVAYADFATAMMAFFMVMWITGQSKPVKQAVAKYFEDPLGMKKGSKSTAIKGIDDAILSGVVESGRGQGRGMAMADLKTKAPSNPRGISATKPPRMVLFRHGQKTQSVGTVVPFDEGSAVLNEAAIERLDLLAPLLLGRLNKVEVRVYAPRRPPTEDSTSQEIWQLCAARGIVAMEHLANRGVDSKRFRISQDGEKYPDPPPPEPGVQNAEYVVEVFASDQLLYRGE